MKLIMPLAINGLYCTRCYDYTRNVAVKVVEGGQYFPEVDANVVLVML